MPSGAALRSAGAPAVVEPVRASCERGRGWELDGVQFTFVHPVAGVLARRGRTNRASCVLRVAMAGHAVLLAADIDRPAEASLVDAERAVSASMLAADVLLVPHHGSQGSSSESFIDAVHPVLAIVSAGYRNRFGHPRGRVIERYAARNIALLRTDRGGAIRIELNAKGVKASAWRDSHPRYYRTSPRLTEERAAP
jgi:competence protein ComEC